MQFDLYHTVSCYPMKTSIILVGRQCCVSTWFRLLCTVLWLLKPRVMKHGMIKFIVFIGQTCSYFSCLHIKHNFMTCFSFEENRLSRSWITTTDASVVFLMPFGVYIEQIQVQESLFGIKHYTMFITNWHNRNTAKTMKICCLPKSKHITYTYNMELHFT